MNVPARAGIALVALSLAACGGRAALPTDGGRDGGADGEAGEAGGTGDADADQVAIADDAVGRVEFDPARARHVDLAPGVGRAAAEAGTADSTARDSSAITSP